MIGFTKKRERYKVLKDNFLSQKKKEKREYSILILLRTKETSSTK